MKILFLDHDGVICLSSNWGSRGKKQAEWRKSNPTSEAQDMPVYYRFDHLDSKAVKVLNEILEETGAEIVVSSDWRRYCSLEEMGDYYEQYGIIKKPIGFTEFHSNIDEVAAGLFYWKGWAGRSRTVEVLHWLENHPEVESWVAVDDLDMRGLGERFVMTPRSNEGIKQCNVKKRIIDTLNGKQA